MRPCGRKLGGVGPPPRRSAPVRGQVGDKTLAERAVNREQWFVNEQYGCSGKTLDERGLVLCGGGRD